MSTTELVTAAGAERERAGFVVEEITTLEALERLAPEWGELWARCPAATPFQSPEWVVAWWRAFGVSRLRTLAVRRAGELVGVAPLHVWDLRRASGGAPARIVSFVGAGITDYNDFLCAPGGEAAGARVIYEHLCAGRDLWDVCDLQELRAGSVALRADAPASLKTREFEMSRCPVIELPRSADELLARLTHKRRRNYRTARRRTEREPEAEFTRARDEAETAELLDDLVRLHERRWRERGESGMFADRRVRSFHAEVARGFLKRGVLRLYRLRAAGETLAVLYGFASGGRAYAYLSGFDPAADRRLSVGTGVMGYAIEDAIGEGMTEFDFLRGAEKYKYAWGATDRFNRRRLLWQDRTPEEAGMTDAHAPRLDARSEDAASGG